MNTNILEFKFRKILRILAEEKNSFMILAAFLVFASCTLHPGDNPYKILGVSPNAKDAEIKAAFRRITKKYHPDISKSKESEGIWVRANDAYELLKDSRRRRIYDQTKSVSDDPESEFHNTFYANFGEPPPNYEFSSTDINIDRIPATLEKYGSIMICVYFHYSLNENFQEAMLYEQSDHEIGSYIPFFKIDAAEQKEVLSMFNITGDFAILYVYKDKDSFSCIKMPKLAIIHANEWISAVMNSKIKVFKKMAHVNDWLKKDKEFPHVLRIETTNKPPFEFDRYAATNKYRAKFAILIDDYLTAVHDLNLTDFPSTVVFSNGKISVVKNFPSDLHEPLAPYLFDLNELLLEKLCSDYCFAHIGRPDTPIKERIEDPIALIEPSSSFAKENGLNRGDFILIDGNNRKFVVIEKQKISSSISSYRIGKLQMKDFATQFKYQYYSYLEKFIDRTHMIFWNVGSFLGLFKAFVFPIFIQLPTFLQIIIIYLVKKIVGFTYRFLLKPIIKIVF